MTHHSTTLLFFFTVMASGAIMYARAKNITIVNECKETIWPGIITLNNSVDGDGFKLKPGETAFYDAPSGWSGRIWARTGCDFKNSTNSCQTGSCGPSLNCTGPGSLPATIAEFTLSDTDFYDVSLVDGFNVPVMVKPFGGKGNCSTAGCDGDLRQSCPSELSVKENGKVIGCRSACDVFNSDQFCCRGSYGDQATCLPSNYSSNFKQVCPAASSYAFDDRTSIITCSADVYLVAFCASRNDTLCSYRDNKIFCGQSSKGLKSYPESWWLLVLVLVFLPLTSNLGAIF